MTDEPEWGPWIEHAPGPCPLRVGEYVQITTCDRHLKEVTQQGRVTQKVIEAGAWLEPGPYGRWVQVVRYRIRKPRGLTILEGLLENLPEKEGVE